MTDDLVKRVARLYEDKWGVTDHGLARAANRAMTPQEDK